MEVTHVIERNDGTYDLLFVEKIGSPVSGEYVRVKRIFDFVFALILGLFALPIVFLFGLLVGLTSKGGVFYSQKRVGYMGKVIKITKLRSMSNDAESKSGAMWAQKNDPRVTAVGKFIRKTRIDELPQIWNVLKGEMSFIGPRPERPLMTHKFSDECPGFEQRLRVLPGLSGYAQIHGGYELTPKKKAELDNYYIEHVSYRMDFHIMFGTLRVILTGDGAR
ncbi:sugar transferase [Furfurilactobacillus curtus]|uniref:Capsular polysaccharide biosynthesis protein n=1 Tax=Furfurilactobacillus curtus TaxID=1746200 RepID=A0ABQ5JMJ9_9LACO